MNSRKGISPLIATVLLIAFTISVGAIIGAWVTGFSRGKTEHLGVEANLNIDCSAASIKFGPGDIGTTKIAIENNGNVDLDGFKIIVQNGTGEDTTISQYFASEVNSTNILKPGDKRIISNDSMNIQTGNTVTVNAIKCINAKHTAKK